MTTNRVTRVRPSREAVHQVHEATLEVLSSSFGVEESKRKVLQVHRFETDPAFVRISAGVTKSTGPYESLRVDASITLPCYAEEVNEVYKRVAEQVAVILDEEVDNYLAGDGNGGA